MTAAPGESPLRRASGVRAPLPRKGWDVKKWATIVLVVALSGSSALGPVNANSRPPKLYTSNGVTWEPPVLVSAEQAHRETSIALSPKDPDLMFICDPSGVPNTDHNQSYFHLSRDGGETWKPERVETEDTDLRRYAFEGGDCDVAFDDGGTMYSADTWLGNLSVGHSRDGGKTWKGTSISGTAPIIDRPWLVGGPKGTVHLTYHDLQCCSPSAIWYTRSDDYGMTFRPVVPITQAGPDGPFTWVGNFVVTKDEENLYLVYTRRFDMLGTGPAYLSGETVWVAASHDGGLTWSQHLVARRPTSASYLYPSIGMDKAGYLHVVFASPDKKDTPIWYSVSTNKAKTWSKITPLSRGDAGFSPWIQGDGKGEAAVVWYGSPDPKAETEEAPWYFYWAKVEGGHTKSPRIKTGRTTEKPIFVGEQAVPEFEMIRLDERGRMHIGMSAYRRLVPGGPAEWAIYYQRQKL